MINHLFEDTTVYALSWTIIHSIWQGAIIAILLRLILTFRPKITANNKYFLALSSLALLFIASLISFVYYNISSEEGLVLKASATNYVTTSTIDQISAISILEEMYMFFDHNLLLICNLWLVGSILFLLKFSVGIAYIRSLYKKAIPCQHLVVNNSMQSLIEKMSINKKVVLAESNHINTPMVIGFLKPMILFPIGVINQLSTDEIESILAHELTHIKRNDFLINIVQSLIEMLFYFNPSVWYISSIIREERENCCDDYAIINSSSNYTYANTLIKLEEIKQNLMPKLAMTLSRDKKSLQQRVKRILQVPRKRSYLRERLFSLILVVMIFLAFTKKSASKAIVEIPPRIDQLDISPLVLPQYVFPVVETLDTLPTKKQDILIELIEDDKNIHLRMEDGEIVEFKVDGKDIPKEELEKKGNKYFHEGEFLMKVSPNGTIHVGDHEGNMFFKEYDHAIHEYKNLDSIIQGSIGKNGNIMRFNYDNLKHNLKNLEFDLKKLNKDGHSYTFDFHENFDLDSLLNHNSEEMLILSEKLLENNLYLKELEHVFPERNHMAPEIIDWHEKMEKELKDGKNLTWVYPDNGDHHFELLRAPHGNNFSDKMARELNRDGLLEINKNNKIELTGKHLKINGDKQPKNIFSKYKKVYEEWMGAALTKKTKIELDVIGKKSKRLFRSI